MKLPTCIAAGLLLMPLALAQSYVVFRVPKPKGIDCGAAQEAKPGKHSSALETLQVTGQSRQGCAIYCFERGCTSFTIKSKGGVCTLYKATRERGGLHTQPSTDGTQYYNAKCLEDVVIFAMAAEYNSTSTDYYVQVPQDDAPHPAQLVEGSRSDGPDFYVDSNGLLRNGDNAAAAMLMTAPESDGTVYFPGAKPPAGDSFTPLSCGITSNGYLDCSSGGADTFFFCLNNQTGAGVLAFTPSTQPPDFGDDVSCQSETFIA